MMCRPDQVLSVFKQEKGWNFGQFLVRLFALIFFFKLIEFIRQYYYESLYAYFSTCCKFNCTNKLSESLQELL